MSISVSKNFRASLNNSNEIDIIANTKKNHRKSRSIDLATLNKTFANLNVQSNLRSEKRGIDKINEIILENEKFVPQKTVFHINTKDSSKSSSKVSFRKRTPVVEVNYNDLLKSLDAIASEVKSNSYKNCKSKEQLPITNETANITNNILTKQVQEPEIRTVRKSVVKQDIKQNEKYDENFDDKPNPPIKQHSKNNSSNFDYLVEFGKKIYNDSFTFGRNASSKVLNDNEDNNISGITEMKHNSKNYSTNLVKKTHETTDKIKNKEEDFNKINDNNEQKQNIDKNNDISNSRKSSDATIFKPDNDQYESTLKEENKNISDKDNKSDTTPIITDIVDIKNDSKELKVSKNIDDIKKFQSLALPKLPINRSNENISNDHLEKPKLKNKPPRDDSIFFSKKTLSGQFSKNQSTPTSRYSKISKNPPSPSNRYSKISKNPPSPSSRYSKISKNPPSPSNHCFKISKNPPSPLNRYSRMNRDQLLPSLRHSFNDQSSLLNESNPARNDSIRYSYNHALHNFNNDDSTNIKRRSFLNQKNNNSNGLRKKRSQNRLSVNRISVNIDDLTKSLNISNNIITPTKSTSNEDAQGHEEDSLKLMTSDIEKDKNMERMMNNIKEIKNSISGDSNQQVKDISHFRPSWAKHNSKTNLFSSDDSNNSINSQEEKKNSDNLENDELNIIRPKRKQYHSGILFSKRNSSLTRFSVMSARTRHASVQQTDLVAMKSKYYRYSIARNMNTYNNSGNIPVPFHHTKLTIPQFNPQQQQPVRKSPQLQQQVLRSPQFGSPQFGSPQIRNSQLRNSQFRNSQLRNSQLRNSQLRNSQLRSPQLRSPQLRSPQLRSPQLRTPQLRSPQLRSLQYRSPQLQELIRKSLNSTISEETILEESENSVKSPKFLFRDVRISNIISDIKEEEEIKELESKYNKSPGVTQQSLDKSEFNNANYIKKPLSEKEQEEWKINMHTVSLYDDENPKPKKNKINFKKRFSFFKKNKN